MIYKARDSTPITFSMAQNEAEMGRSKQVFGYWPMFGDGLVYPYCIVTKKLRN